MGRAMAASLLARHEQPKLSVAAAPWFCICSHHQLQICCGKLCWPAPFLKNTNSSNFVENERLTWLIRTPTDYRSAAELFFRDKNSSAGIKAFICQTFSQLKWRTCYRIMDTCVFTPTEGGLGLKCSHVNIAHLPASMWIEGTSTRETGGGIIFQIAMSSSKRAARQHFPGLILTTERFYAGGKRKNQSAII